MKNPYEVLEISPFCTMKDIKKQFRKMSMLYHPDRAGQESTAKFQEILEAYNFLEKNHVEYNPMMSWVHESLFTIRKGVEKV